MKLITKALEKRFAELGEQDIPNPIVVNKVFSPSGSATFFMTSYNPETRIGFGFVKGLGSDELGYFSLDELESLRVPPFGLPLERDLHCGEKTLLEHCPELAETIKRNEELRALEEGKTTIKNKDYER